MKRPMLDIQTSPFRSSAAGILLELLYISPSRLTHNVGLKGRWVQQMIASCDRGQRGTECLVFNRP